MASEQPLAIQFSDLRGFSSLTAERGDQEAFRIALEFVGLVQEEVEQHDGRLLKTYGDGVMTSFEDAVCAVEASAAMQARLCEQYRDTDEADVISAGIGVTWGSAIRTEGDLFGHSVNLAKRLADVAKGGQIVSSESLRDAAGQVQGFAYRELGDRELKGVGRQHLYELVWRPEVDKLAMTNDQVDLILTEDRKLVVEFAKTVKEQIREAVAEIRQVDEGAPWLEKRIKAIVAKRLVGAIPRWIDWGAARAGMGLEHAVENVEARIHDGKLVLNLGNRRDLSFDAKMVNLASAERFVERLRTMKAQTERGHKP